MFPVSDVIPSRTTPFVTISLIGLNALASFYQLTLSPPDLQQFFRPLRRRAGESVVVVGRDAHVSPRRLAARVGNMLYLWIFGDNVEDRVGHSKYILFYLGCGAVAALGRSPWPHRPS